MPLDWGITQNNLGVALQTLGERESGTAGEQESGTAHLQEAVAAWEACLTVTASAWPSQWVQSVKTRLGETRAEIEQRSAR